MNFVKSVLISYLLPVLAVYIVVLCSNYMGNSGSQKYKHRNSHYPSEPCALQLVKAKKSFCYFDLQDAGPLLINHFGSTVFPSKAMVLHAAPVKWCEEESQ